MKVNDILEHFLSRADWVNRETTCDRVILGDPDAEVDRCLVTWMPSLKALRCLVDRGLNFMVCHEPTFWSDLGGDVPYHGEKLDHIQDHGITILRNHDCWDRWPDVGIPWSWAQFLGLGTQPAAIGADGYQHRYDIDPVPLETFARDVAQRCGAIGEPLVQVTGDGDQMISRIGIGTGCGCQISAYQEIGCDCSIVCDDGSCYWADIQRAEDTGHPVIRVNHGTSEEPGMVTLTQYINDHVDGLHADHLPHGSTFELIGTQPV
ncbi:MAG: hypothetical protein CMJ49_10715 [Planctomycetaceae bacterium]|nr:hypothetical protein [Planctomycetaceae bacterium]